MRLSEWWKAFTGWVQERPLFGGGRLYLLSAILGLGIGAVAILFTLCIHGVREILLLHTVGYDPPSPGTAGLQPVLEVSRPFLLLIVAAAGGLLMGLIAYRFAPECFGGGTEEVIRAFHHGRGLLRGRVVFFKIVTSALTLGSGGSGGKEGPITQVGAAAGSRFAQFLGLRDWERRVLLTAGVAAGMGAVFKAPLGGALFACEVYYSRPEFETQAVIPSFIASILAFSIYSLAFGFAPLFALPEVPVPTLPDLLPLTVLAILVGTGSVAFVNLLRWTRREFDRMNYPPWLRPAAGGFAVGLVAWTGYQVARDSRFLGVLSEGYGAVQQAVDGNLGIGMLLALAGVKMLTSALTFSSGGSAGLFAPSMVIGGCLGGAVGLAASSWFPHLVGSPSAFIVLGMGGFFAGTSRAPISTIIMMTEVAQSYDVLLPLMWVCAVASLISARESLFEGQLPRQADSPAHRGEYVVDVLKGIQVDDLVKERKAPATLAPGTPLRRILQTAAESSQVLFPVVDKSRRLQGVLTLRYLRDFLYEESLGDLVVAQEIMRAQPVVLHLKQDLEEALGLLTEQQSEELPVVDGDGRFLGLVARRDIMQAYSRAMLELRSAK